MIKGILLADNICVVLLLKKIYICGPVLSNVHCFTAVVRLSNLNMMLSSVMLNSLHFEPSRYKVSLHKLLLVLAKGC